MFEEVEKAISEIQQPRSRFQLERFVLGQHTTPEMQYYQVCVELQDMIYKYKLAQIEQNKTQLKISRLRASKDELDELEAQELELGLMNTRLAVIGAQREIAHLLDIFNGFETKYTREQIETAQPDYWKKRLTNNAKAMLMGGSGVNPAHIEAMQQAGVLEDLILEVQESKKELGL